MKAVKTLTDPEAFKILADDTRRRMIFLLRAKEMTVSQIADQLDLTPQTVYHHIKRLLDAEMVEVAREVRVDHLIESYYQATAEVFHVTVGKTSGGKESLAESIPIALDGLKRIGFNVSYDKKDVEELAEMTMQQEDCCGSKEHEEAVSKLDDLDLLSKETVQEYATLISMTDEEMMKQCELKKSFRKALRSLVK
jgi:DNA-binding transcriptional ArsR family regulator